MPDPDKETPKQETYLDEDSPPNAPEIKPLPATQYSLPKKNEEPKKSVWWEKLKSKPPQTGPDWVKDKWD